ncbi:MAG: phage head-tail connector protein [Caenispirillum sp.]|nr:phage head-tail connector protein [Caenispirillum sp.]
MGLKLITPPAEEPITVAEFKDFGRVDGDSEDSLITALIVAARQRVEKATGLALVMQTWKLTLDRFPFEEIALPLGPVITVDDVSYHDKAGTLQTLVADAEYEVDTTSEPARVVPHYSGWPSTKRMVNAVEIEFTAGFGVAADVPEALTQAVRLMALHLYDQRAAVNVGNIVTEMPLGVADILRDYRAWSF